MKKIIGIWIVFSMAIVSGCAGLGGSGSNSNAQSGCTYVPNDQASLVTFRGGEPEGFNSIKWQTVLSQVEGMKFLRTDFSAGGIDFYRKDEVGFLLPNGKVAPVQYGFWRDKFYVGMVTTQGLADWNLLKEGAFNKFGVGAKPFLNKEEYLWVGKVAVMALRYDERQKMGTLYIRYEPMEKEMQAAATTR
jgi:hypothetical protein